MKRRVVITGLGVFTPIGKTVEAFWKNALNGDLGIDFIQAYDASGEKAQLAAEIKDYDPKTYFDRKWIKRLDRFVQFGMIAAREAYIDAKLNSIETDRERWGVVVGTGVGGIHTLQHEMGQLNSHGMNYVSPICIPKFLPNMVTGNIAMDLNLKGISNTVMTACASGTNAIGEAYRAIQYGDADLIVAGGSESCITPLMMAGFTNMNAVTLSHNPKRASIPFDKERNGFVLGEGAGMLILESYEHAHKRNAKIYAEILGYGFASDAYHLTAPHPEGDGAFRAMKQAMEQGRITKHQLSYINAHGTSTSLNDAMETKAIKRFMGEIACHVPISSTKSMIGHLQGASGAIEAIASIKSIETQYIHGTAGYMCKDPECDLDYVTEGSRAIKIKHVLSNSFGFGGHNASLLLGQFNC